MIELGYACVNTTLPSPARSCRLSNATPARLLELGAANLQALTTILRWNAERQIRLFRISSDTIPFASHPVNTTRWWEDLAVELDGVGQLIREEGVRVSMHPGQFTVLNSNRPEVVDNAVAELEYHNRLLENLGVGSEGKIVIHLGGTYGDKAASVARFESAFRRLAEGTQSRIVIENDERSYSLADALEVHQRLGIPVVFDIFHDSWNPSFEERTVREKVELASDTWRDAGRPQKIHYSNQAQGRPPGAHSRSLYVDTFAQLLPQLSDLPLDLMLETKDKERSLLAARKSLAHFGVR